MSILLRIPRLAIFPNNFISFRRGIIPLLALQLRVKCWLLTILVFLHLESPIHIPMAAPIIPLSDLDSAALFPFATLSSSSSSQSHGGARHSSRLLRLFLSFGHLLRLLVDAVQLLFVCFSFRLDAVDSLVLSLDLGIHFFGW